MKINYYILMKSILANHRKFNHILISCLLVPKITWPSVIAPLFVKHIDVGAVEKNAHLQGWKEDLTKVVSENDQ